jgi:hypothetical protein
MDNNLGQDYYRMIPEEVHDLLRKLYDTKLKKDTDLADWIINVWKERWSLENRLGDMDRTLDRFLPPVKDKS